MAQPLGGSDSSTQRPSVAMPIGTTSYFVAVDGRQHAARGHARDGVLAGAATEDDGDAGLRVGSLIAHRPYPLYVS